MDTGRACDKGMGEKVVRGQTQGTIDEVITPTARDPRHEESDAGKDPDDAITRHEVRLPLENCSTVRFTKKNHHRKQTQRDECNSRKTDSAAIRLRCCLACRHCSADDLRPVCASRNSSSRRF